MLNYNPHSWLKLIFSITKTDTIKKVAPYLVFLSLYTLGLLLFVFEFEQVRQSKTLQNIDAVYSILGFVISLLLAFRTNTAYERWWEGRKTLGVLNNTSRMLAIKLSAALSPNDPKRSYFIALISSFVLTLKNSLRDEPDYTSLHPLLHFDRQKHLPLQVLFKLTEAIEQLRKEGAINDSQYLSFDSLLKSLVEVIGICERIKNTPIPYSYSSFIKKFIFIYTFTLPVAWMFKFGYYTILAVSFVLYVLMSLEFLAAEIENPFGTEDNDLPFDDIVKVIQHQCRELLQ